MSLVALANVLLRRHLRHALPRRSARQGDRAAAAGARAARGHPVRAAAGRRARRGRRRWRRPRRGAFDRRTRASPHTHFLSNGRYTVAVTHAGGGSSTWRGLAVTRQREDRDLDAGAHFIYLRDPWSGDVWSPTYQPVCREPDELRGHLRSRQGRRSARRDGDFETQLEIAVSPEDDVEVRRLSITNRGDRPREIEVTSYAEIVLARPEDDLAHPGVRQAVHRDGVRRAERRPAVQPAAARRRTRRRSWAFHVLGVEGRLGGAVEWETDRARFIGRGRSPAESASRSTAARCRARPARCSIRSAALRDRVRLAPGAVVRVTFATGVAADRATGAGAGAQVSRRQRRLARVLDGVHARAHHAAAPGAQRRPRDAVRSRWRRACSAPDASCISPADVAANTLGQPNLWGYGISGDLPIVLVRVARRRARCRWCGRCCYAQEYWRVKGLRADVVILNEHPADYLDEMQDQLTSARAGAALGRLDRQAGRHVPAARGRHAARPTAACCRPSARVVLRGDLGDAGAADRIGRRRGCSPDEDVPRRAVAAARRRRRQPPAPRPPLRDGERHRRLHAATAASTSSCSTAIAKRRCRGRTCSPIRSSAHGQQLGAAFTWAGNSRENRLTPFANDPISDPDRRGDLSARRRVRRGVGRHARPAAARGDGGRWVVRHAAGVTRYRACASTACEQELRCPSPPTIRSSCRA